MRAKKRKTHVIFHIFRAYNHHSSHTWRAKKWKTHVTFHVFKVSITIDLIHGEPRNEKLTLLFTNSKHLATFVLRHGEPRNGNTNVTFRTFKAFNHYIVLIHGEPRNGNTLLFTYSKHLRGYCTSGPYFWRLFAFSQKMKQLWTKKPMDLVRNVPRNSKTTTLLQ